jgi:CDP-paratose 2-epimerase
MNQSLEGTFLITGGAGFMGSNYVARLLQRGSRVRILDNLSRKGARLNLQWLLGQPNADKLELVIGDVRDPLIVDVAMKGVSYVAHLAAQVAVTTSVTSPREDFEINATGTLNVLEAARAQAQMPVVLYSSTNKVYGGFEHLQPTELATRYALAEMPHGISETSPLDFHSPYGCSKGAADQYVRDYSRIYGLPSVVLRQSCIYGPRQFGMEDQGWIAWFIIQVVQGRQFTIYGDGKQVRDVLHVEDLLNVFDITFSRGRELSGSIFNIGGGPTLALSVWAEFGPMLQEILGCAINPRKAPWRPGDQRLYISDIRSAETRLGWKPAIRPEEGIRSLVQWVRKNSALFL